MQAVTTRKWSCLAKQDRFPLVARALPRPTIPAMRGKQMAWTAAIALAVVFAVKSYEAKTTGK